MVRLFSTNQNTCIYSLPINNSTPTSISRMRDIGNIIKEPCCSRIAGSHSHYVKLIGIILVEESNGDTHNAVTFFGAR